MANVRKVMLEPVQTLPTQGIGKLKVAAYCRVSTDRNEQKSSFEGQVKTYSILVQTKHTAGWCCEQGDDACRHFAIRSGFVENALLDA